MARSPGAARSGVAAVRRGRARIPRWSRGSCPRLAPARHRAVVRVQHVAADGLHGALGAVPRVGGDRDGRGLGVRDVPAHEPRRDPRAVVPDLQPRRADRLHGRVQRVHQHVRDLPDGHPRTAVAAHLGLAVLDSRRRRPALAPRGAARPHGGGARRAGDGHPEPVRPAGPRVGRPDRDLDRLLVARGVPRPRGADLAGVLRGSRGAGPHAPDGLGHLRDRRELLAHAVPARERDAQRRGAGRPHGSPRGGDPRHPPPRRIRRRRDGSRSLRHAVLRRAHHRALRHRRRRSGGAAARSPDAPRHRLPHGPRGGRAAARARVGAAVDPPRRLRRPRPAVRDAQRARLRARTRGRAERPPDPPGGRRGRRTRRIVGAHPLRGGGRRTRRLAGGCRGRRRR